MKKIELSREELDYILSKITDNYSEPYSVNHFNIRLSFDNYDIDVYFDVETEYCENIGGSYEGYDFERICDVESNHITITEVKIFTDDDTEIFNTEDIKKQIQKSL